MTVETGTANLSYEKSGALRIYVKKQLAASIDLPTGREVKVSWDNETRKLTIEEL